MRDPFTHAETLTSTPLAPTKRPSGVFIACTVAGTVKLQMISGAVLEVPVPVGGSMIYDVHVVAVAAGGTATAVASAMFVGA